MSGDLPTGDGNREPDATTTPITQIIGRVVVTAIAIAFIVFALANAHHVNFSWVVGETRVAFDQAGEHESGGVRLILLLLGSAGVGFLVGLFIPWRAARHRKRSARRSEAQARSASDKGTSKAPSKPTIQDQPVNQEQPGDQDPPKESS